MSSPAQPRNVLQGYVTNIEFGGLRVPATMQNLMLRDYAARNNLLFKLSVGEYNFPGCYLQLDGLLPQLPKLEGIGMCSMFMLPKSGEHREQIYTQVFNAGAALHLVLEKIVLRRPDDAARVEETLRFHEAFKNCVSTIPEGLLPPLSLPDCFT